MYRYNTRSIKIYFSLLTNSDFSSKVIDQSAASEMLKIRAGTNVINIFSSLLTLRER
jgi:hypothetical protein